MKTLTGIFLDTGRIDEVRKYHGLGDMSGQRREDIERRARRRVPYVEEYYDLLRYEVDPLGAFRLCRDQSLPHITVNGHGYRGRPLSGLETVLLLGDSVTFGVGASGDQDCFSRFLEGCLGQPVADASVRAYRVFQHFAQLPRLLNQIPRLRFVVLWCGYADLLYWASTGGCIEGAFQLERKYQNTAQSSRSSRVSKLIGAALVRRVQERCFKRFFEPEARAREMGDLYDLVRHMVTYICAMRDLCVARAIKVSVLVQPFVRMRPSDSELRAIMDFYNERILEKCGVGWYETAPTFVGELMRSLGQRECIDVLDCQSLVCEGDFLDQVHLRERSLERLAQQLVGDQRLCALPARFSNAGKQQTAG